jgi:hypothetical protein
MGAIPPSLTLPLEGGGDVVVAVTKFPLPLEGGGMGGGDRFRNESES